MEELINHGGLVKYLKNKLEEQHERV